MSIKIINEKADELIRCENKDNIRPIAVEFIGLLRKVKFKKEHDENKKSTLDNAQNVFGFHKLKGTKETKKQLKKEVRYLLSLLDNE